MNELLRGRSLINILLLTLGFIVFFFTFVVFFFIPAGKEYKKVNNAYVAEMFLLDQAQNRHEETTQTLKELQVKNRSIILAYENSFDAHVFNRDYTRYFEKLQLTLVPTPKREELFDVYEVTTTSKISSPTDFYAFLEGINKSENIVSVEFPIHFVAQDKTISASFRMKVFRTSFNHYLEQSEVNTTHEEEASDL